MTLSQRLLKLPIDVAALLVATLIIALIDTMTLLKELYVASRKGSNGHLR
jgi:hypothetical protein